MFIGRGYLFAILFYLSCAIAATIYVSLVYLNDNGCDCRDYVKRHHEPDDSQKERKETPTEKPSEKVEKPKSINSGKLCRFNRAALLNVGFLVARNDCDYIAMHDVDLLPLNKKLFYGYPEKGPFHVSAPHLHPKYHYRTFVGGILMMSVEHFEKVNGLSNNFWGWGREDDELYQRMMEAGLTIYRHGKKHITTGYNTFEHDHDPEVRKRDYKRLFNQRKVIEYFNEKKKLKLFLKLLNLLHLYLASFRRDRKTGISNIDYEIMSKKELTIDGAPLTIVNVELECDYDVTPWCDEKKKKS
ncbi:hypothetical protein QZH41_009749 [Actinostola sp. cb2023]|nr:hypothetical protein QZH41_009749 [Actinostola sp. cb2023]